MELDLDKARAARQEARGEGNSFVFGGVSFSLPTELTLDAAEAMESGNFRAAMAELLNGQAEKFFALKPTVEDLNTLVSGADIDGKHMPGLIDWFVPGSSPGESPASSPSSARSSKKSRRPSSANTTSN